MRLGEPRGPSGLPAAGTGFRGEVILVNGPRTGGLDQGGCLLNAN